MSSSKIAPVAANKRNFHDIVSNIKRRGTRCLANTDLAWHALLRIKPPGAITNQEERRQFRQSCSGYGTASSTPQICARPLTRRNKTPTEGQEWQAKRSR